MKHIITLSAIVVFAMIAPQVVAQSGGLNVKNVSASEKITVGSESDTQIEITDRAISLQPLTKEEILALTPQEGMLVYDTDSDVVKFYSEKEDAWLSIKRPEPESVVPCASIYRDQNGNIFLGVQIGTQCWMDRNLKATHYPNGDAIPYVTDNSAWAALGDNNTDDAYCYYDNNTSSEYGFLYTYAAAIADDWQRDNADGQGICPDGWHLPSDAEWTTLTNYLNGSGGKMKEGGFSHWNSPNTDATNESGFTALPGGFRTSSTVSFSGAGDSGHWWSATEYSSNDGAWYRNLGYGSANVGRYGNNKSRGISVRCLRDY